MKHKKNRALFNVLLVVPLSLNLLCTSSPVETGKNAGAAIAGIIYMPDGITPAAGAVVHIRPRSTLADTSGYLPKSFSDTATVTTDHSGRFAFNTILNTGTFVIEADDGDNNHAIIEKVMIHNPDSTIEVADTLKPAGTIKGLVYLTEGGDLLNVFVLAFGIDRFAQVENDGNFRFEHLAEGSYDIRLISSLDDYGTLDTNAVPVISADTTDLDTIILPFKGIPTPKDLAISYDTLNQTVRLAWAQVDTNLCDGYNVYRAIKGRNFSLITQTPLPQTTLEYLDSAVQVDTVYEYRVVARTTAGEESKMVDIAADTVKIISSSEVTTVFEWNTNGTINDSASINDTVEIMVSYKNPTRIHRSIQWYVATGGAVIQEATDSSLTGIDTLMYWWHEQGEKNVFVKAIDDGGTEWTDSFGINVLKDMPVPDAGEDTSVSINDTVDLHGTATDKFGSIITWEWDVGNTGTFMNVSPDSAYTFTAPASADSNYVCVLKVTDDDNNVSYDTVAIMVLLDPPIADAGNDTYAARNTEVTLDGSGSRDRFGTLVTFEWDLGCTGSFIQTSDGSINVTTPDSLFYNIPCCLRITDDDSVSASDTIIVKVGYFQQVTNDMGMTERWGFTTTVFDGKMWLIAGYSGYERSDVWYSTNGIDWTMLVDVAGFVPCHRTRSVVFNDRIFLISGYASYTTFSSPDGLSWQGHGNTPGRPEGHTAIVYDNKIWKIAGGRGDENNDVYSSEDGTTWTTVTLNTDFEPRGYHTSVVFDGKMWVIGGLAPTRREFETVIPGYRNDVWYSTDGLNWTQATNDAGFAPRYHHASIVYDNKMWVFGGQDSQRNELNDAWYSYDGSNWILAAENAGFTTRYFHEILIYNNKVWLIGGIGNSAGNDVWVLD